MKAAEEWVNENSQSGAFDCVHSCKDAVELVEAIQNDAVKTAFSFGVLDIMDGLPLDDQKNARKSALDGAARNLDRYKSNRENIRYLQRAMSALCIAENKGFGTKASMTKRVLCFYADRLMRLPKENQVASTEYAVVSALSEDVVKTFEEVYAMILADLG